MNLNINNKHNLDFTLEHSLEIKKKKEFETLFPGLTPNSPNKKNEVSSFAKHLDEARNEKKRTLNSLSKNMNDKDLLKEIKSDSEKKKAYAAALDFQSIFIEKMLSSMRKNLNPENDLLYGGSKQKIFEDMLYQEYSNMLSHTDHFNMALDIYKQIKH